MDQSDLEELEGKQKAFVVNEDDIPIPRKRSSGSKVDLTRNENIFIYAMVIFDVSFYLLKWKNDLFYKQKYENCVELMTDVCNLPSFDYQRRDELLLEAKKRAARYQYTLKLGVVSTTGIEKLTSRAHEDEVYLHFGIPGKETTLRLFQTHKGGPWMPAYELVSKRFHSLFVPLSNKVVKDTFQFTIKLVVKKYKYGLVGSLAGAMCFGHRVACLAENIVVGTAVRQFSDLNPQDEEDTFLFNYKSQPISLCVRYRWVLKAPLFRGGYYHFRRHWEIHGEIFEQFLRWLWRHRSSNGASPTECTGEQSKLGVFVPQNMLPWKVRKGSKPWQGAYSLSELIKKDFQIAGKIANLKRFCICSEWCSIDSFYFHNPFARFILCENHILFVVPDKLIVPHHFKAIACLISQKSFHCVSLLSSSLQLLYEYLHEIYFDELSSQAVHFWSSQGGKLIRDGYFSLRQWIVKPESFKITRKPFECYSNQFVYFVRAITWLSSVITKGKDSKLEKKLRFKFQDLFMYWIEIALENPSLHVAQHAIYVEYLRKVSREPSQNIASDFYMLKMYERDIKDEETHEKLKASISALSASEKKCIVLCSNALSLVHQVRDFLIQIESHVRFYLFDKQLYKNESWMTRILDSIFREKQPLNQFDIEILWPSKHEDSEETFVRQHYTLSLYSTALDIQSFIICHTAFTFHKEFGHEINLHEIIFFTSNDWIENVMKPVGKLFPKTSELKEAISTSFKRLYDEHWLAGTKDDRQGFTDTQTIIYEAKKFVLWFGGKSENDIFEQETAEMVKQITVYVDHAKEYLKSQLQVYQDSATDIAKPRSTLILLTLKASFYNVVNLSAAVFSNCLKLFDKKSGHRNPIIFPGWFYLFKMPQKISGILRNLHKSYESIISDNINLSSIIDRTLERITLMFSMLYIKLGNEWLAQMESYSEKNEILRILLLIGQPLIEEFSSTLKGQSLKRNFAAWQQKAKQEKMVQTIRTILIQTTDIYNSKAWKKYFDEALTELKKDKEFEKIVNMNIKWNSNARRPINK